VTDAEVTLTSSGLRSDSSVQNAVAISGKPIKTPVRTFLDRITSEKTPSLDQTGSMSGRFARGQSRVVTLARNTHA
jgi:hypothetical protein